MNKQFVEHIVRHLHQQENTMISGLSGGGRTFFLNQLRQSHGGKMLVIVPDEEHAYDLASELKGCLPKERIFLFLLRDMVFVKENVSSVEYERLLTLEELSFYPQRSGIIICTAGGLLYEMLSPEQMKEQTIVLQPGQEWNQSELIKRLVEASYERVDTVNRPGQMAMRGGIFDIYPAGQRYPCRIEFFGDEIENIKRFDSNTQRSGKAEKQMRIGPADELGGGTSVTLLDYVNEEMMVFFDEPREVYKKLEKNRRRYQTYLKEAKREEKEIKALKLVEQETLMEQIKALPVVFHSFFPGSIPQVQVALYEHLSQKEMEPFYKRFDVLQSRLEEWTRAGYSIQIAIHNEAQRNELKGQLSDWHITGVEFVKESYTRGFVSSSLQVALLTDNDLWGKKAGQKTKNKKVVEQRLLVEDLKMGDYVVHENYGIGIFRGVTQVTTDQITREYILLQYAGTDKLYLPVDKLDLLYRYSSSGDKEPRLQKLGGTEWERTRAKVAQSIQDMAEELLKLYATRETVKGFAFSADTPWQQQFEDDFPYQETPDQLKAIIDVKTDMERLRPMDRLVCGDVGYGKTEVALRAAFKAIMDGKQVAILVPTTVLAEQHYQTFLERLKEYPAQVEVLSRFKTSSQQKKIIKNMETGTADIVIATHRLLSKDIKFLNLGLLIIDEEHRFGVVQKEKIKALKEQIDVLSLSATPIPRSLHMSLTGLRDLSVIETPPPQRYPITTYVMEYDEELIREAVLAEKNRGGQVFFVHNRIQDIYRVQEELKKLVPEVSIAVGHGRMTEDELSETLVGFVDGKVDVLLCTTIIESGLDIPNVNTIIVDMADRMGLAQLYQLRGRVGRSNRVACAYLTYRPDKILTEEAQKRLNAIREFNELGSGMKIALRDLEIRGAGNILGPEQHGYIHAVGFDLYCRLLEQQTVQLKGEVVAEPINPQLDIDIDYYIPDSYIPDSGTKMRIYRRLMLVGSQEELDEIRLEVQDRFGTMPEPVANFFFIAALRIQAKNKEIKGLRRKGKQIELQLVNKIHPQLALKLKNLNVKKINENTLRITTPKPSLNDLEALINLL
ncbi:MAG: transcription-repair coupling factor [Bacillota bacterium]|nr:transcription-repair coupling factor [Bacillota bacterium]